MRDIRMDLRERLVAIDDRERKIEADYDHRQTALNNERTQAISAVQKERVTLRQMLDFEERRTGMVPTEANRTASLVSLAEFLVGRVHAAGPMEKDELREAAEIAGYFEVADGRSFHLTLLNITKGGKLIRGTDGRYALPERQAETLFGMGRSNGEAEMKILM